jgi:squalene-hopene/tetraprenyl-beta-curcumene cyclase
VLVLAAFASPSRAESEADEVVSKSVKFLISKQAEDGSWHVAPGKAEIGIVGLLVKGLHESGDKDAGPAVEKAVAWLLKQQQADGSFNEEKSSLGTYRTAIAVLALCSVDKAKHAAAIEKAKKWLVEGQFDAGEKVGKDSPHFGGWNYDKKGDKPDTDLSNAQWAIMALKEAGVSKDDPVMKRAVEFVSRCQNNTETNKGVAEVKLKPSNDGGFYYAPSRPTAKQTEIKNADGTVTYESYASMTYAGLTSLIYAGMDPKDPRVKAALGWIKNHYTLDENHGLGIRADAKAAQQGLFYYYLTFARALDGLGSNVVETKDGPKHWAKDLIAALKARQKPDGSFSNEADRWMEGLPVLATAYALGAANLAKKHLPAE